MGKPGATDWSGGRISADPPELQQADHVLGELAHGRTVAAADRTRAAGALVDLLWRGGPGDAQRAVRGLGTLSSQASPRDRMRLLGEAVAAGRRALPLFDDLAARGDLPLSHEETAQLRALVEHGSAEHRFHALADLIDRSSDQGAPRREPPSGHRESMLRPRSPGDPPPQGRAAGTGSGDGPDGQQPPDRSVDEVWDRDTSPADKVHIIDALGEKAVPVLLAELGNARRSELATVLLLHLAKGDRVRRLIYDGVQALGMDQPELRDRAGLIARAIEQNVRGAAGDDFGARSRIRDAGLATSVLERALSLCDRPSLLLAGAGREVAAIPLAMVRLGELRGVGADGAL